MSVASLKSFYEELKRRRVIRVATLYVVAIWPIIQLLDIISPALEIPESVLRYLVIAFFSGLPFALILAWIFDLDRDGVHLDDGQAHEPFLGSRTDLTLVAVLCVLVVGLFLVQVSLEDDSLVENGSDDGSIEQRELVRSTPEVVAPVSDNSIAVKPFDSFSENPRDQYFADGLSEELLNVLARVPELRVAARTSSFAYKGVNRNISEIGRELSVAHILEGSVRANDIDNTIRVTAQLINVESGQHVWSETYTHQYSDVFKIQDEISGAVAEKLKVTLFAGKTTGSGTRGARSSNPEALIAFGRGQQELSRRSKDSLLAAASYFETAVAEDQNFALAFAGLCDAYTLLVSYEYADRDEFLIKARQAVDRALELDPELGIAWASKGLLESQYPDKKELARSLLKKAMKLNPSYAMAVMWYATLIEDDGEKMQLYERAVKLDPKSPVASYNLASMYAVQGRDAEVMTLFSHIVESDPNYPKGYELVAQLASRNGRIGEAIRHFERAYELSEDLNYGVNVSKLYADIGDFEQSDIWYQKLAGGVPEEYKNRVLWFRIGRFVGAKDSQGVTDLLRKIEQTHGGDLETEYDRLLARYYLGDRKNLVRDYDVALASGKTFTHQDEYIKEFLPEVQIVVASQLESEGESARANELLASAEATLRENLDNPSRHWPEDWYGMARIYAVRGQQQQALIHLQRAVDEGWREHWRPGFDPIMQTYESNPVFVTMMAGLENRLTIIRDQFEMEAEFAMGF
tara:strand:- start:5982 stop:8225 length:2244 start_codon:yes stop_codon:yes gene_type:complete